MAKAGVAAAAVSVRAWQASNGPAGLRLVYSPLGRTTQEKLPALLTAVPVVGVSRMLPLAASTGTCTVRLPAVCAVNSASAPPPKRTPRTVFRLVPVMVTSVPAGPLPGEKLLTVGACAQPSSGKASNSNTTAQRRLEMPEQLVSVRAARSRGSGARRARRDDWYMSGKN